jgi:hypothetical protein
MAFLTMRWKPQLVATDRKGFSLDLAVSAPAPFATGCHRSRPRGSMKAPSFVVAVGYIAAVATASSITATPLSSSANRGHDRYVVGS